jgi:hypothetical protein
MNVNENKWDDVQEEMRAQVGSLPSRMDAYLEEMKACQEAMEACLGKTEARIGPHGVTDS